MNALPALLVISEQAIDRIQSDARVRTNLKAYRKEIRMIASLARLQSNAEVIGDFRVSPQGRSPDGIRVAWTFEREGESILIRICDFLYHVRGDQYVDEWNTKARRGSITKASYSDWASVPSDLQ